MPPLFIFGKTNELSSLNLELFFILPFTSQTQRVKLFPENETAVSIYYLIVMSWTPFQLA